jgi:hypothetical protein
MITSARADRPERFQARREPPRRYPFEAGRIELVEGRDMDGESPGRSGGELEFVGEILAPPVSPRVESAQDTGGIRATR